MFKHQNTQTYLVALIGALLIPLTYLLTVLLINRFVGLTVAFFIAIDPIVTICSQRIWMENTICLFSLLTVTFFIYAIKLNRPIFILLSAIAAGCALLTKYPGILPWISIVIYWILTDCGPRNKKYFYWYIAIPLILFFPWLSWNLIVYQEKLIDHLVIHEMVKGPQVVAISLFLLLLGACYYLFKARFKDQQKKVLAWSIGKKQQLILSIILMFGLFIILLPHIITGFNLSHIPTSSWNMKFFEDQPFWFYLGRITAYSLFACLGVFTLFWIQQTKSHLGLIRLSALMILIFYILWGNFQCRYILQAIPFIYLMSGWGLFSLWTKIAQIKNLQLQYTLYASIVLLLVWSAVKTIALNIQFAYPNIPAYF